ncbi:hypothetical protein LCGC14_2480410 [marine sediment metagenome]|uniref:Uncharacterized protein n=1 Tax=marine sediment metagenome TaxID=412755 RepID=A0A0F9B8J6_9ZZZZ
MRRAWLLLLPLACIDVSMPNAVERAQFAWIAGAVQEQARERPPSTEREAERLTEIKLVALDGVELAKLDLKRSGHPNRPVPRPTDHAAVRFETERYAEDVEAEAAWRGLLEPFTSGWGLGATDAVGGGAFGVLGVVVTALLRKLRRKDRALDEYDEGVRRAIPEADRKKIKLGPDGEREHEERKNRRLRASAPA